MILKMKSSIRCIISLFIGLCYVHSTYGDGYVITTPRRWTSGSESQVCLSFRDVLSEGENNLTLSVASSDLESYILPEQSLVFNSEAGGLCVQVRLLHTNDTTGLLTISGTILGNNANYSEKIAISPDFLEIYIQTDKWQYKPSQIVKFRILSVIGPKLRICTHMYDEIYMLNPQGIRIFQMHNVSNEIGLMHQEFQLADELVEGIYSIYVTSITNKHFRTTFKVEDYTLPRFEVTIKGPNRVIPSTKLLTYEVCAKYPLGQPVVGNVTMRIHGTYPEPSQNPVTQQGYISGCAEFNFTSEELNQKARFEYRTVYLVTAAVAEEGTKKKILAYDIKTVIHKTLIFSDLSEGVYYKPASTYVGEMKVTFQDDSPASNTLMRVCSTYNVCRNMTTNKYGILKYAIPHHLQDGQIKVRNMAYKDYNNAYFGYTGLEKRIRSIHSPSNSALAIELHDHKVNCIHGQNVTFSFTVSYVATEVSRTTVSVQMLSRGQIIFASNDLIDFQNGSAPLDLSDILISPVKDSKIDNLIRGSFTKTVKITDFASTKAKLLVFYTRPDGEVVSDVRTVHIGECLLNPTALSWSTKKAQPGEEAVLSLTGEPNSICSLGVVDKSVQLLSAETPGHLSILNLLEIANKASVKHNDFKLLNATRYCINKKFHETRHDKRLAKRYGDEKIPYKYSSSKFDALKMFNDAGVYAFTDMKLESRPCSRFVPRKYRPWGVPTRPKVEPKWDPATPRTNVPETWLWQINIIPNSGVSQANFTLPHTINEWAANAVCVHPTKGFGISNTAPITAFSDFFTDLLLPATLKRGEIFPLKITVFNYLSNPLPVNIVVEKSSEYEILSDKGTTDEGTTDGSGKRSPCISKNDKVVQSIRIRPIAIGNINIIVTVSVNVNASTTCGNVTHHFRTNRIIKPIRVDIEGFLKEETQTIYAYANKSISDWSIAVPENIVADSARGFIVLSKHLMGPTIENLGHLIRMPDGKGEQNMLNFVSNVFVMPYLDKPEAKSLAMRAIKNMKSGYQRQLKYRHTDWSYSAFGKNEDTGSTWYTAFVLKSFVQARKYIFIDHYELGTMETWLRAMQQSDGCFKSVGNATKGGISDKSAPSLLSSYVMIALLEAGTYPTSQVIDDTLRCINANPPEDSYALAVKAYALALVNDPTTANIIQELIDIMEWPSAELDYSEEIEKAGYTLLAMLTFDSTKYATKVEDIVKWISAKQNGRGGFFAARDTIVALQAIAKYESLREDVNGTLDLFIEMSPPSSHNMTLGYYRINDLLMQKSSMDFMPVDIKFHLSGEGSMMIQSVLRYNEHLPEPSRAFNLSLKAYPLMDEVCIYKAVIVCVSYLLPDLESNMGIVEVTLVSGYVPMISDLEKVIKGDSVFKRYEVDGNLVRVYVDKFTDQKLCFSFGMKLEIEIENPKPGTVAVYDYYKPEYYATETYVFPDRCVTIFNG